MSLSANKTKDWLKNQLVSHGVPLPASTAKKEEYQRLYDEQVLPKQNSTEFSSDDDTEEVSPPPRPPSVAKNTKPDSKTQNGDGSVDKRVVWVERLSDANLFTALKANGRDVGPILESTRSLYQKTLLEILKSDDKKAISEIENYLSLNKEARESWQENGVELNGGFNGVTNGNSENGYSDTDDDETVETASRASRSSRASSKRMTPIRSSNSSSTPVKESTPTHRTLADSNVKVTRRVAPSRDDALDGINEMEVEDDDDVEGLLTASSSRSPTMSDSFYSRVTSPSIDSPRFSKPYSMRRTVTESVEKTHSQHFYEGSRSETLEASRQQRGGSPKAATKASKAMVFVKYLLLLVAVVGIPFVAYMVYLFLNGWNNSENCVGSECAPSDELDVLLQSMDDSGPGVQSEAAAAGGI